jgi:adenylate cyclase
MRRYTTTANLVVAVMGLLVFWLSQRNWVVNSTPWQKLEGALIDQRYHLRGERPGDTNIVLVGINDSSLALDYLAPEEIAASPTLQLMTKPFPWNRAAYAATLDKLMGAGAKVVVFDFMFVAPNDGDKEFAEMLKKYPGQVILAANIEISGSKYKYNPPASELSEAVGPDGAGLGTVWDDADGVLRRGIYQTSLERESRQLSDFAGSVYPDNLFHMTALAVKKFTGHLESPPYQKDNFIDYQGPAKTYIPLPIEDLFVEKLWNAPPISGETTFRNKIVIVGPIANIFQDLHNTPFGVLPGPEIQAQMTATLLNHSSLREPSAGFNTLLTLGMVALALAICLLIKNALLKPALLIITTFGFWAVCQYAFSHSGVVVAMMPPLFGFVASGSLGVVSQFILEQIERYRYLNVLERYVSKNVAKSILDDKRSFLDSLSGRKQSLTVMFSDIRGFTSMTEGADPEHLVKQLNEYFMEMVGIVLAERGTLQKFIGDAIMAAWGDVHSEGAEEDARRAVRTTLQMRAALAKLDKQWAGQANRSALHIGMGVNHGEMIVGNIGHPQRMEFTVLGDGVNLAARLETATKQFHTDLLVGESVEALTRQHFIFRRVGLVTFKGKTKPVDTFNVLGERPEADPPWLGRYHEAIGLFHQRQFEAAGALFKAVAAEIGGPDALCDLYLKECATFANVPPPAGWNGSFVLSEK